MMENIKWYYGFIIPIAIAIVMVVPRTLEVLIKFIQTTCFWFVALLSPNSAERVIGLLEKYRNKQISIDKSVFNKIDDT
ncbi:hypothetical protein [Cochleicola gelatinilyticus]|uniref:Uncharacterized protein n=1 Tax=Cochleicola gelatinilyticus TaxID=1763537 RepID=A0A167HMB0_9FLAO|nr:hypothetical protein [Cochleicola gelatinilyticus]OAB78766.1 hypothetical protein ULVI_09295 [Cochleicola gelatinilyticus]